MCLIIDANVASEFSPGRLTAGAEVVVKWMGRRGCLAVERAILEELRRAGLIEVLRSWQQAGKLKHQNQDNINSYVSLLKSNKLVKSQDYHILALAIVSGARILFSRDKKLTDDFKNNKIINPKGKIFQSKKHSKLLSGAKCK